MKIDNSQTNFKSVQYTPMALRAMSKRMPSGAYIQIQEKLNRMYKESPLDIIISTAGSKSNRLLTLIKQNAHISPKKLMPECFKESFLSSIFCNPEKYFEKLCEQIDKKEVIILGKRSRGGRELTVG